MHTFCGRWSRRHESWWTRRRKKSRETEREREREKSGSSRVVGGARGWGEGGGGAAAASSSTARQWSGSADWRCAHSASDFETIRSHAIGARAYPPSPPPLPLHHRCVRVPATSDARRHERKRKKEKKKKRTQSFCWFLFFFFVVVGHTPKKSHTGTSVATPVCVCVSPSV